MLEYLQKQLFAGVFQVGILKNFTIFAEKHPCGTLFLIKLQAWRPITLTKRCFPVFIAKFLRTTLFIERLWWLLLYLFNKVTGLKTSNVVKKKLQQGCVPVKFAKFLRTTFFTEHLRWLLPYFMKRTNHIFGISG